MKGAPAPVEMVYAIRTSSMESVLRSKYETLLSLGLFGSLQYLPGDPGTASMQDDDKHRREDDVRDDDEREGDREKPLKERPELNRVDVDRGVLTVSSRNSLYEGNRDLCLGRLGRLDGLHLTRQ